MSQLYVSASKIIQDFWNKHGSLKTLTFSNSFDKKSKLYALAYKTLKANDVLDVLYKRSSLSQCNIKNRALLYVMLYDHIFGKSLNCGGKIARIIKDKDKELMDLLHSLQSSTDPSLSQKIKDLYDQEKKKEQIPKYIRINTCIAEDQQIIDQLHQDHIELQKDSDIDHLYLLVNSDDLHDHPLVQNGSIVIQSKPSCFPAAILLSSLPSDLKDYIVIDACAAPGNKTTHCASLLQSKGSIYACDKDSSRYQLLSSRIQQMKCSNVTCLHRDFLSISSSDELYHKAKAILLDPSCSGTGMTNNLLDTHKPDFYRIKQLASFQLNALLHAMSFPHVERITYSTCSIMNEENEKVVLNALNEDLRIHGSHQWKLACALPSWSTRGHHIEGLTEDESNCLVRSNIDGPLGQGFFVAYFIRADATDLNAEFLKSFRVNQTTNSKIVSNVQITKHSHKRVKTNATKRVRKVAL